MLERQECGPQLFVEDVVFTPPLGRFRPGGVTFDQLAALPSVMEPLPVLAVDPAAPALVLSSSGTSGRIKAVPMTHWQLLRMYDDVRVVLDADADDVWLGVVPLTHSFGINGILLVALMSGACVRLLPDYHPERLVRVLRSERVTVLAGPPAIYHDLVRVDPGAAAAHTRIGIVGSSEVSAPDTARLARQLGIPRIVAGYGMTETCGTVAIGDLPADPVDPLPWMSPMPGVEVRICDQRGASLPPRVHGSVQVRGYPVCRPYAAAPDLQPGGWFDTGDIGELDRAGRLAIVGRSDDMVIVSGFNVHPHEVESVLATCPGVAEVSVVGVPDPRRGQRLVGCIVPVGVAPTPQELDAHARRRLSGYKVPGDYVFLDSLPLTPTDKVSRAALRRRVEDVTRPT